VIDPDWLSLLTGGGLVSVGYWTGWLVASRRRRGTGPRPVEAICPCEHHIGDHEGHTGACHGEVRRSLYHQGEFYGYEWAPCTCQRYAGPELISMAVAQGFTIREVTEGTAP
jgi:hypothetical protein